MKFTAADYEAATGVKFEHTAYACHVASLDLVLSGVLPEARVARGSCAGVAAQHSWVALGDPYDPEHEVIDPSLWSWVDGVDGIWTGRASERPHLPNGSIGSIWMYGKPSSGGGPTVELDCELPPYAREFLKLLGPLDMIGWSQLAHAPVRGWPAGEIIGAMYDDMRLRHLIPIDIVGMATDRNPGGLYLPRERP